MAVCQVCGNDYHAAMQITAATGSGTFDSFECAIHALAPRCTHCGCRILGHGVEVEDAMYCCGTCAGHAGASS